MKKTVKELNDFQTAATIYLEENKEETGLHWPLKRMMKRVSSATNSIIDKYKEDIEDSNNTYAATDEKGFTIFEKETVTEPNGNKVERNTGVPKTSPSRQIEKNKFQRALLKEMLEKTVDIEPYIAKVIPELNELEIEAFEGYVIPVGYTNPEKE